MYLKIYLKIYFEFILKNITMDKSEKNITVDNKNVITRRKVIRGKTKISEIPVPEIGKSDSSHFGFGSQFSEFGKSDSSNFGFGSQFREFGNF